MNQNKLKEIAERWKGKSGGPEAETTVSDSKLDKNCVHVWSCTSDVTKIIDRCGSAIRKIREDNDGVAFEIDRSAFRGAPYAFKVLK
tara:strand:- start:1206 stop:1466 length:261 start_codon:yes stop_codon:yes gene_type:complete